MLGTLLRLLIPVRAHAKKICSSLPQQIFPRRGITLWHYIGEINFAHTAYQASLFRYLVFINVFTGTK
jgi:hypothetical protein